MSPAWLAAPAMNARDTTKMYCIYGGLTLDVDRLYIGSVTATTHQETVTFLICSCVKHQMGYKNIHAQEGCNVASQERKGRYSSDH